MRPPSKPLPRNQAEFEAAVIASVLRSNAEIAEIISNQLAHARVVERWGSGAGFFVEFEVSLEARKLPDDASHPLDAEAFAIEGVEAAQGGGHFFHENGYITELECYGFGNGWPEHEYIFRFFDNPE